MEKVVILAIQGHRKFRRLRKIGIKMTTNFVRKAFQRVNNCPNKEIKDNTIIEKVLENSMI